MDDQSPSTPRKSTDSTTPRKSVDHTPRKSIDLFKTPTSKKRKISCDRFITTSAGTNLMEKFKFIQAEKTPTKPNKQESTVYRDIMVNELLPTASPIRNQSAKKIMYFNQFMSPKSQIESRNIFSSCSLSHSSQQALKRPKKVERYISKTPYKVLDAPELQDDFYLNLVDWSSTNYLGVGLGSCVYLWSANTSRVIKLCDLGSLDSVTSVSWGPKVLATNTGQYCSGRDILWNRAAVGYGEPQENKAVFWP